MIHLSRSLPRTRRPRRPSRLLLPLAGLMLAATSCSENEAPPDTPPVSVTDTRPVGDGLKVIGYALLGGAVVVVLGSMIRK